MRIPRSPRTRRLLLVAAPTLAVAFASHPPHLRASDAAVAAVAAGVPSARGGHAPAAQGAVRVLVVYDLEGAAGVVDGAAMNPQVPEAFARGRESLVVEVNAVVAGLLDAGATGVDVVNAHGYGGDSLVPRERLDPRAGIVARTTPNVAYNPDAGLPRRGYGAVVVVAMHDKPRSGGFSPHTLGAGLSPVVNGATVTETQLVGYAFGTAGVPVILASGDDRLRGTLAAQPWAEYVTTKRALGAGAAEPRDQQAVVRELRAGAARALRLLAAPGRMRAMALTGPTRAGLVPTFPAFLPPGMGNLPGLEKRGDTVTFVAPDYAAAWRGTMVLVTLAVGNRRALVLSQLQGQATSRTAVAAAQDSIDVLWAAYEAGRWQPQ
jgi:D-amino peptidase